MKGIIKLLGKTTLLTILFVTSIAHATWSSYEYRDSDGDYKYGIKDGDNKVKLGLKNRKKADKVAKKMNKNDKKVMAGPDGQGDYRPGGNFPR